MICSNCNKGPPFDDRLFENIAITGCLTSRRTATSPSNPCSLNLNSGANPRITLYRHPTAMYLYSDVSFSSPFSGFGLVLMYLMQNASEMLMEKLNL